MEFQRPTRNNREHKVSLWSGPERIMFPDCSLVLRKSFETTDGGKFAHTFTETSARKQKLSGTDGNRRNIANMLDPKTRSPAGGIFRAGFGRLHRNLLGSGCSRTTSPITPLGRIAGKPVSENYL